MDDSELWAGFALDPRLPAHAALRASDADRDRIAAVLAEAFVDGRLDRGEHDDRSATLLASRTLGELPPLVVDLAPPISSPRRPADLQLRAEQHWQSVRRAAVFTFLTPTIICWIVWTATMAGGFPWPLIVTAATGLHLARTLTSRDEVVTAEVRRLGREDPPELAS